MVKLLALRELARYDPPAPDTTTHCGDDAVAAMRIPTSADVGTSISYNPFLLVDGGDVNIGTVSTPAVGSDDVGDWIGEAVGSDDVGNWVGDDIGSEVVGDWVGASDSNPFNPFEKLVRPMSTTSVMTVTEGADAVAAVKLARESFEDELRKFSVCLSEKDFEELTISPF